MGKVRLLTYNAILNTTLVTSFYSIHYTGLFSDLWQIISIPVQTAASSLLQRDVVWPAAYACLTAQPISWQSLRLSHLAGASLYWLRLQVENWPLRKDLMGYFNIACYAARAKKCAPHLSLFPG